MVEAAVAGVAGVEACRIEIDRGGPSYTADTVRELLAADALGASPMSSSAPTWPPSSRPGSGSTSCARR